MERLRKAAAKGFHGHRDSTAILLCFRHGLRASELCALTWDDVADLTYANRATLNVRRVKGSVSGAPLEPDEVSALRRRRQERSDDVYVFTKTSSALWVDQLRRSVLILLT